MSTKVFDVAQKLATLGLISATGFGFVTVGGQVSELRAKSKAHAEMLELQKNASENPPAVSLATGKGLKSS